MRDHIGPEQVAVSVDTRVGVFLFLWTLLVETISSTAGIAFSFSLDLASGDNFLHRRHCFFISFCLCHFFRSRSCRSYTAARDATSTEVTPL